jgi:hypothetical protein
MPVFNSFSRAIIKMYFFKDTKTDGLSNLFLPAAILQNKPVAS